MITLHFVRISCYRLALFPIFTNYTIQCKFCPWTNKQEFIFKKLCFMYIVGVKSKITRCRFVFVCFNLSKNSEKCFASCIFSLLPAIHSSFSPCSRWERCLCVIISSKLNYRREKNEFANYSVCYWEKHEDVTRQVDFNIICALSAAPLYARALGCVHSR